MNDQFIPLGDVAAEIAAKAFGCQSAVELFNNMNDEIKYLRQRVAELEAERGFVIPPAGVDPFQQTVTMTMQDYQELVNRTEG